VATIYWRGGAGAVAQISRVTFSAYTSGVTYTLTVGNQSVSFTATASTEDNVVDGLIAAISAAGLAEFSDFTASNATAAGITLSANAAGIPFTITGTASGGVTGTTTADQAATGPNYWSNGDNWSSGSVPTTSDDIVFEDSSVDVSYDLDQDAAYPSLTIMASYTGRIGLPSTNSSGYVEYRQRFLIVGDGDPMDLTIGQGAGAQSQLILIDVNQAVLTFNQYGSGTAFDGEHAVTVQTAASGSTVNVFGGQLEFAGVNELTTLRVTPSDQSEVAVQGSTGTTVGTAIINGGRVTLRHTVTTLDVSDGAEVFVSDDAAIATVSVATGATVFWSSTGAIGTLLNVYHQGIMDFSRSGVGKAVQAAKVYHGGVLSDPLAIITWTTGIELVGCRVEDVTLDVGRNKTLSVS
jgi:hypothetical protein